ncbi:MAG: type 1 glutamine amidotransferase domain-containing protein [Xanthomonadales bacterium]|nr:type 1 glutamine amidotransferase domain-containing protein [Xanthomonadales bacterium]
MKHWIKRSLWALAGGLLALAALLTGYVYSLDLDAEPVADRQATAAELGFGRYSGPSRGRILAIVSSAAELPGGGRGGFELTELSRAWWVFIHNGFEVDIASPAGGEPPMVLDDDLIDADYAFLNDAAAMARLRQSLPLAAIDPGAYAAVYVVGGKGAMVDLPIDPQLARLWAGLSPEAVIGAVCHGPAALLQARDAIGKPLLQGRRVTGFSNEEELQLIPDARQRLGFLLQDALAEQADYAFGPAFLDHTIVDGRLITGQNPWSTWSVATSMIEALGHVPVARPVTSEERSVALLATLHTDGLAAAISHKAALPGSDKRLLLMHGVLALLQGEWRRAWWLDRLARAPDGRAG